MIYHLEALIQGVIWTFFLLLAKSETGQSVGRFFLYISIK
jgi:hypothetical protein